MASKEARDAAIEKAARMVRSGCPFLRRAHPGSKVRPLPKKIRGLAS